MDDIFHQCDLNGVKERPAELGAFSTESLFVKYSFTYEELLAAFHHLPAARELPDVLKTVVHESTHLFHTIATPFGFLIYAVRRLQAHLVTDLIWRLRMVHKTKLSYPLIDFVRQLPESVQSDVWHHVRAWYICELFILQSLDRTTAWEEQQVRNPILRHLSPTALFARVQKYLAIYYNNALGRPSLFNTSSTDVNLPLIKSFELENSSDPRSDMFAMGLHMFGGNECNSITLYELAGTVAEFWLTDNLDIDTFFKQLEERTSRVEISRKLAVLMGPPIRTRNVREFVLSFLALCDLAFFGPVLPFHKRFREKGADPSEIFPFLRWLEIGRVSASVRPMSSLDDYQRYTDDVCGLLGWVSPSVLASFTTTSHVAIPEDVVEDMFISACHFRLARPPIFQDYDFHLMGSGRSHSHFLSQFNFPVIQYADQTTYLRDKDRLSFFLRCYLIRLALRTIFLRDRLTLRLPYRPKDTDEVEFLKECLKADLEQIIGVRIKDIELTFNAVA